ncbi:MAG: XrtA-associated tyrosine autokinase [Methylococcales bacterium]
MTEYSERPKDKTENIEINWSALASKGFLTPDNVNYRLSEEYRAIKRPLINNALNGKVKGISRSNLILITSSLPNEGKTYSAINLAVSIACERDKNVLLIDADIPKPSVAKTLDIHYKYGLTDYLDGTIENFSDSILQTNLKDLSIICSGKHHSYSTELFASNRMQQLVNELTEAYSDRIIIIDSAPLLATTQGEVLASMAGQIVLVVEAEQTPQEVVLESIRRLKSNDVVLLLLNKSRNNVDINYYGYGQYGNI